MDSMETASEEDIESLQRRSSNILMEEQQTQPAFHRAFYTIDHDRTSSNRCNWFLRIIGFMIVFSTILATTFILLSQVQQYNLWINTSSSNRDTSNVDSISSVTGTYPSLKSKDGTEMLLISMEDKNRLEKLIVQLNSTIRTTSSSSSSSAHVEIVPVIQDASSSSRNDLLALDSFAPSGSIPIAAKYTPYPHAQPLPLANPKSVRGVVTSFVSHNSVYQLSFIYPSIEKYYLQPFNLTWILFWERYPINMRTDLHLFTRGRLRWTSHVDSKGQEYFLTPSGTKILSVPLVLNLPRYIERNASLLDDKNYMKCHGGRWSFDYVLYTTTSIHAMLRHRIMDHYDVFMKVDTDIQFLSQPPLNPFEEIASKGCMFAHTAWNDDRQDCHEATYEAMMTYSQQKALRPLSADYPWCKSSNYFYSNFIFGQLSLFRSVENRAMEEWFYEIWPDGYFKRRWTDQAVWPKMLCMWLDIPDMKHDPQICDFSVWRDIVFRHKS